jgi:hypothetical protein
VLAVLYRHLLPPHFSPQKKFQKQLAKVDGIAYNEVEQNVPCGGTLKLYSGWGG